MKTVKIITAAFIAAMPVTAAKAAVYNVGGIDYDITVLTEAWYNQQVRFESQVWWGDSLLAEAFAEEVGSDFGTVNGDFGPYFAFGFANNFDVDIFAFDSVQNDAVMPPETGYSDYRVYAIAREIPPVPLPAAGLLLLSGLAGVVGLKRRKNRLT